MKKYELFATNDQVNRTNKFSSISNLEKLKIVMYATTDQKLIGEKDQAYEELKQALKRNEPMKRILHQSVNEKYPELLCPSCFVSNDPLNHYCPKCGQKLDWSKD